MRQGRSRVFGTVFHLYLRSYLIAPVFAASRRRSARLHGLRAIPAAIAGVMRGPGVPPSQVPREHQLGIPLDPEVAVGVPRVGVRDLPPLPRPLLAPDVGPQLVRLDILDGDRLDRLREQPLAPFAHLDEQPEDGFLLGPRDALYGPHARSLTEQMEAEQRPVQRQAQVPQGPLRAL